MTTSVENASSNQLTGGPGDDMLFGRGGDDWYLFEPSNVESDTVGELPGEGTDTLSFINYLVGQDVHVDLTSDATLVNDFTGRAVQTAAATQHENFENVITGDGDDSIVANESNNVLQGGLGNDDYVFTAAASVNTTTIIDVGGNTDTLNFSTLSAADPAIVDLTSDSALALA